VKDFFKAIESLFVDVLFAPYDALRFTESWALSNIVNWIFFLIGLAAMIYWTRQLKTFNDNKEEDKSVTSHSYL